MKKVKLSKFTRMPGGRYREGGHKSGEEFREDYLSPALREHGKIVVDLDRVRGIPPSFVEEAFGGLVREFGPVVCERVEFIAGEREWRKEMAEKMMTRAVENMDYPYNPSEFVVGQKVWWVDFGLAIKCTILHVDAVHAKNGGTFFYQLDEPVGCFLAADELCLDREEAEEVLSEWQGETSTLPEFRERRIKWLKGLGPLSHDEGSFTYPEKEEGTEWFAKEEV